MIRRLIRQMLTAQILSALTVSLCLLIDSIMIGRFLGDRALTAYGLANPVLLIIGAVGSTLCAGAQVSCSRSLGRGDQTETDVGYSSAVATAAVFSLAFMIPVLLLNVPIARLFGADEPALLSDTSRYMAGFSIGAPACVGALILVPFLQMAGQSNLLIAAVLGMTVADVAFDLLNVLVLHGGMFGMGLASALSYYVAVAIGSTYFLSKKCVFTFSLDRICRRKIRELVTNGLPSVFAMAASVVLIFAMNHILLGVGGAAAVAAFSVVNTLMNASYSVSTGSGGVALTLSSILFNEEDRTSLSELLNALSRACIFLGLAVMVLLMAFARPLVSLFIPYAGLSQQMAVYGLRVYSLGITCCCLNSALRSCYQGTGRVRRMELISALENGVMPVLMALMLSSVAGMRGVWFFSLLSETLVTLGILCAVWLEKKRVTFRTEDILLLHDDLGVPPDRLMEADLGSMEAVMAFSHDAEAFCLAHGGSARLASHLALCIEEMGGNIVTHGFKDGRRNRLAIRLQCKNGRWTLRFRDDCMAFDPVSHVTKTDSLESVGIRLAMRISDEARYTYSMNLNNLVLILRDTAR